jgi:hypothetical protein
MRKSLGDNVTKEELDAAITVVESSISGMETWVIPFAILVAVGVAGEAVIGVKQLLNNRELHGLRVKQGEFIDQERAELKTGVAKAEKSAADSKLALEKFKAPRRVDFSNKALEIQLAPFPGTQWDALVAPDIESRDFLSRLETALRIAKWAQIDWKGVVPGMARGGSSRIVGPIPSYFGGVFSSGTLIAINQEHSRVPDSPVLKAAEALAKALKDMDIACSGVVGMDVSANASAIHLIVGPKL